MIEAFIILPAHLAHEKPKKKERFVAISSKIQAMRAWMFEDKLPGAYERVLRFVLHWRYVFLAGTVAVALIVLGLRLSGIIPFVFIQKTDAETIVIDVEMQAGTPEERTLEVLNEVERVCLNTEEVQRTFSVVGVVFTDKGRQNSATPPLWARSQLN